MTRTTRLFWTAAWLGYVCFLLRMALGPVATPDEVNHMDKLLHVLAFLVLALAAPWPQHASGMFAVMAAVVVLGAGIEAAQYAVPHWGRSAELLDFLADLAGGGLGLGLRAALGRRLRP